MTDTPAGWHPDPEQPGQLRYWDGNQWTEHRQPAPPPAATPVVQQMQPAPPPMVAGGYGAPMGYGAGGTPFVAGTAPQQSSSGCLKAGLIILAIVVVLAVIGTVGLVLAAHKGAKAIHDAATQFEHSFGPATPSDFSYKITSCTVTNDLVSASGTFTNKANRDQAYTMTIDDGNDGQDTVDIPTLTHGESYTWTAEDLGPPGSSGKGVCTATEIDYDG